MKHEFPSLDVMTERTRERNAASSPAASALIVRDVNRLPQPEELVAFAAKLLAARAIRKSMLPAALFAEAGWNMLLALYSNANGRRLTISNMYHVSQVPDTTALRWVDKLVELGLARRQPNPLDARVFFVELEPAGRASVEDYLFRAWDLLY